MKLTFQAIQDAAKVINGSIVHTPCTKSLTLSMITGAQVILKFENHQFTGSFKDRGALHKLHSLSPAEKARGVVAMSAGNHAQAVAYHAQRLGVSATIVMPRFTPNVKVEQTKSFGATVMLHGVDFDEAATLAHDLARDRHLSLVHPYDDERVIAGQGTTAVEMLQAHPDLEALLVPIGGGGLIAGCAIAAKHLRPTIHVYGVEAARFPAMRQTLEGKPVVCKGSTIADGIAVKQPGALPLPIIRELVDDILLVEEEAIEEAVLLLLEIEKTVVEGAGAVGLAALLKEPERFKGRKVGIILSGGNLDLTVLSSVIQRGLVRSGRLVRMRAELPDRPGALGEITKVLGEADTNIVEIVHQRSFTNLPLKTAEVEFILQTRGVLHLRQIEARLKEAQFHVTFPDFSTNEHAG